MNKITRLAFLLGDFDIAHIQKMDSLEWLSIWFGIGEVQTPGFAKLIHRLREMAGSGKIKNVSFDLVPMRVNDSRLLFLYEGLLPGYSTNLADKSVNHAKGVQPLIKLLDRVADDPDSAWNLIYPD